VGCCKHGSHLPDDLCLIEPVDAAGAAVTPGSRAQRVYVTNLYNHALPLVRYEVTDELTVLEGSCPCGSALRRIEESAGTSRGDIRLSGPSARPPARVRLRLRQPHVVEYQVCQTEGGADIRVVAAPGLDTLAIKQKIEQALAAVGVDGAAVTISLVSALGRQRRGKLRRFVPLSG